MTVTEWCFLVMVRPTSFSSVRPVRFHCGPRGCRQRTAPHVMNSFWVRSRGACARTSTVITASFSAFLRACTSAHFTLWTRHVPHSFIHSFIHSASLSSSSINQSHLEAISALQSYQTLSSFNQLNDWWLAPVWHLPVPRSPSSQSQATHRPINSAPGRVPTSAAAQYARPVSWQDGTKGRAGIRWKKWIRIFGHESKRHHVLF